MSRTQKDTVKYFPHDADASNGDTLTVLQVRFGNDGYAFWFKLLEKLAGTDGHFLDLNETTRWQLFLARMDVSELTGVEILKILVEMRAIDPQLWDTNRIIWCQKLVDNMADVYQNRRRPIPQKPFSTGSDLLTTPEKAITTGDNTQTKLNEIKLNKTINSSSNNEDKETANEVYEKNISELSEVMENEIKLAVTQFSESWVKDAIREAAKHNKKSWVYVAGILKNWTKYGRRGNSQDADKFTKGKYGHMVQR